MYKRYCLDNGIRVVSEHIPYVNSISIGIWVKSGSRYENSENNGVSHFIEHMLFKGTKNRSAKKIAEDIEELGGQINAFTGKEATCYYVKLLDEHYDVGIDVLSDMIINPRFLNEDIEKEKSVIQEEISMYEDSPEDLVSDIISIATWKKDNLSFPILGSSLSIKNMSKDKIMDYYNSRYTPENIVISVAGNFDEARMKEKLSRAFQDFNTPNTIESTLSAPSINRGVIVRNKEIEQIHFALTLNGIELGNDKLYTLLAINNYFGGGTSSQLFQKIREESGYVYTIYSFPSSYKNCGIFNIYFALNESCLDNAVELVHTEIENIVLNKMTDIQIKKSKEQLKGNYILGLESISSRMFGMGKSELMSNKVFEPKEILTKIDAITKDDVSEVIDSIFKKGIFSAACVGKNVSEEKLNKLIWR
jgi:predicted Zn-dependent peptidase